MKKTLHGIFTLMLALASSQAANYLTVDFATGYTAGNLAGITANAAGQNDWKQTSSTATTPIQINANQQVVIGASGQDVYKAFTSAFTKSDGTSIFLRSRFALTGSTATGDYFMHLSPTAGDSTSFLGRIGAKLTAAGASTYLLGAQSTSGSGSLMTYGTRALNLNTFYDVILKWDFVAGGVNDTFSLFVDPTSNVLANLNPYVTANWLSITAEPTTLAAVNLRQGSAGNATTALISSLSVGSSLSDVGVVPEPSSGALLVLGGVSLVAIRSLRKKNS
jgi:hypothetical protein